MIESSFLSSCEFDMVQDYECMPDIPIFDIDDLTYPDNGSGDISPYSNDLSSSSDDFNLDELNLDTCVTEEFVSEILQESNAGFSDLDWLSTLKDSPKKSSFSSNVTKISSPGPSKSKNKKSTICDHLQSSKLWSEMSETEQLETLHALSEIVTFHMCIREQMEVIRIIDPSAIITAEDKEFALDSTYVDDIKLERIKDILRKQTVCKKSSKSVNTFSSIKSSKKERNSSKLLSRKSNSLSYSRTKRKQKKQDNLLYPTEDKQLKLKRQKQTRKEQKSGFFVYERKMKLVNPTQEDEEDINILE